MALVRKTSPIGIDFKIDQLQNYLFNKLGWSNYGAFGRAYRNPREDSFIPEVDAGGDELEEVFFDDKLSAASYTLMDESLGIDVGLNPVGSIYFQVKLDEIKPNITHRADEEVIRDVIYWLNRNPYGIDPIDIVRGIPNVYSGLKQDQIKFDNMSNHCVFRIVLDFPIQSYSCLN